MRSDFYVLVPWPECQDYMCYDWFRDEAIPGCGCNEVGGIFDYYFIPVSRYLEDSTIKEDIVKSIVKDLEDMIKNPQEN